MTQVFQVPTPIDDDYALCGSARTLQAVGDELVVRRQSLVSVGTQAAERWIGASSDSFATKLSDGAAYLDRITGAHQAQAQIYSLYGGKVEAAKSAAQQAQAEISAHLQTYRWRAQQNLQDLQADLNDHLNNANNELQKSWSDFSNFHPGAAFHDFCLGAGNAAHAAADWAVKNVAPFLDQLAGWQPPTIEPELTTVRPGIDRVELLAGDVVLQELTGFGDFLASRMLVGFDYVLTRLGLESAARAIHNTESQFAQDAAAAHQNAARSIHDLEEAAVQLAEQVEHDVLAALQTVWHLAEDGVNIVKDYGFGLIVPLIAGMIGGLIGDGFDFSHGRRLKGAAAKNLDSKALQKVLHDPKAQANYAQMMALSHAIEKKGFNPNASIGDWKPVGGQDQYRHGPFDTYAELYYNANLHTYVLVFRGSRAGLNWIQDGLNFANSETQSGDWAIRTAQHYSAWVAQQHPPGKLTFAGHSLGGSLAATASLATGDPASTFNAAGVGDGNYAAALRAHGGTVDESQIVNFATSNDGLVSTPQDALTLSRVASGAQITMTSNTANPFSAHGLDAFPHQVTGQDATAGPVTGQQFVSTESL